MLLGEFLELFHGRKGEKGSFKSICQEYQISYKKLRPLLRSLGYEYDAAIFEWVWTKADPEPFNLDLSEQIPMRIPGSSHTRQKHSVSDDENHPTNNPPETFAQHMSAAEDAQQPQQHIISDQLFDIVDLLQQINNKIPAGKELAASLENQDDSEDDAPLALQIHRINTSDKTRKTINISESAAGWLDRFSATKGYKIGDLVSLAVLQLQSRIDPKLLKKPIKPKIDLSNPQQINKPKGNA